MRLLLLRHGPAGVRDPLRWPDDDQRPLTEKGAARTRAACHGLLVLEKGLTHVITSPLVRAEQTARILAEIAELPASGEFEPLAPGGSWREVMTGLEALTRDGTLGTEDVVALVGHEPDLGKLAGVLVFGAPQSLPIKKSGACSIDFAGLPTAGTGRLRWALGPRGLRLLARSRRKVKT